MGNRKLSDLVAHIENDPERRARVDALEQEAWDELAAYNLAERRRASGVTRPGHVDFPEGRLHEPTGKCETISSAK